MSFSAIRRGTGSLGRAASGASQLLGGGALLDAMPTVPPSSVRGRLLGASPAAQKQVGVESQALGEGQGRRTPCRLTFECAGPSEPAPPSHHPACSPWLSLGEEWRKTLRLAWRGEGPTVDEDGKDQSFQGLSCCVWCEQ